MTSDTIFALSSGRPPAAIAVVRVSGPRAADALTALAGKVPQPRQSMLARLRDAAGEAIDDALVLWFPGPHSETGEDTAEFQLHGGRAVIAAVLTALGRIRGLRPAEAGEFTRRAFLNGKLDLTRVEGLADLIGAETEAQRRQALRQLTGLLGDHAERWRAQLIEALALVEALIDFPDEEVGEEVLAPALALAAQLEREIRGKLADKGRGERLRDGLTVVIAGPVNVGKSSIMNRLARRPAAIVSPFAGTTRDVIEVHLDLAGYPVTVLDTAGLRESDDPVEQEGVRRARDRAAEADLILWVVDATDPAAAPPLAFAEKDASAVWIIVNKCDLTDEAVTPNKWPGPSRRPSAVAGQVTMAVRADRGLRVSALTGAGFEGLVADLADQAAWWFGRGESSLITRERHRSLLTSCVESLARALVHGRSGHEDLIAEELRLAAWALGRLTGRVDVEDVLDVIFRDFCIGK
jgi:tRNA modification GTPase